MRGFHWCLLSHAGILSSAKGLLLPRLPLSDVHDLLCSCHTTTDHASLYSWHCQRSKHAFSPFVLCFAESFPCHAHEAPQLMSLFLRVLVLSSFHTSIPPAVCCFVPCSPLLLLVREGTGIIWCSRVVAIEVSPVLAICL